MGGWGEEGASFLSGVLSEFNRDRLAAKQMRCRFSESTSRCHNKIYNIRRMCLDTATQFLTSVGDLDTHRVMFQSEESLDEFHLLHLLSEHKMTIVKSTDELSLFVASSQESLSEIIRFLRNSVSETGEMMDLLSYSAVTVLFTKKELRRKFYAGWAKLTTNDDFLRIFCCSCPPVMAWFPRFPGEPTPDALMTLFMNNVIEFETDGDLAPYHATLSYYMRKLDGRKLGVTKGELPPLPADCSRKRYKERGTVTMLRGTRLPPLPRDDSVRLNLSTDREGLYRWTFA